MSIVGKKENTEMLKNEILHRRKSVHFKINQLSLLRNLMVANYQRMMEECVVYEKELEKIRSENARYKFVGQCLMKKVEELTGCKFEKSLTGSGKNDEEVASLLEVPTYPEQKSSRDSAPEVCPLAVSRPACKASTAAQSSSTGQPRCGEWNLPRSRFSGRPATGCCPDVNEEAAWHLEVCSNKLLAELEKYRERADTVSRKLADARDQLAKESTTEECLKNSATNLTILAEADWTRRNCEETELRKTVERLTAELGDARCDVDRLRMAVEEMSDVVIGCSPAAVMCSSEGLREENIRLQADLKANFEVEAALHAKVVQLKTMLQQQTPCKQILEQFFDKERDDEINKP